MSHYNGSVPETPRAADWRDAAACHSEDAELFFASEQTAAGQDDVDQAKAICRRCPSAQLCLQYALDNHIGDGIFGGHTADERKALKRRQTRGQRVRPLRSKPKQPAPATLQEAFTRRTGPTDDGHVLWYGSATFKWQNTIHNALRVAFQLTHGREPEGPVRRACDGRLCFAGEHLTDARIREEQAVCGTTAGYARHLKRGEATCAGCRRANADGDNRLRWTGTTKALAS